MTLKPTNNPERPPRRERIHIFTATQEGPLLGLLIQLLPSSSRTTIKQYLRDRCVQLAGHTTTQFNAPVSKGDSIEIYNIGTPEKLQHPLVQELYRDDYFIVLHKRPGIPTISVGGTSKSSLFQVVAKHLKKVDSHEKIFLLNRLDRETEGIIIVARERQLQQDLLAEWHNFVLSNQFEAVVLGSIDTNKGELYRPPTNGSKKGEDKHCLRASKSKKEDKTTSPFRASYQVISTGPYLTRLTLSLFTRNNSIRSALASLGIPLLGDHRASETIASDLSKYLALRATEITIYHPILQKRMQFTIDRPFVNLSKIAQTRLSRGQKGSVLENKATIPHAIEDHTNTRKPH